MTAYETHEKATLTWFNHACREATEPEARAIASLLLGLLDSEQEQGNHPAAQTGRHEFTYRQVREEMERDPKIIWNGERFVIRVD